MFALIYIYIYPYPAKWIYSYSKKRQMELNKLKNDLERMELLTIEQSIELRQKHLMLEDKYKKEIQTMTDEISFLKSQIIIKEPENVELKEDRDTNIIEELNMVIEKNDSSKQDISEDNLESIDESFIEPESTKHLQITGLTDELLKIDSDIDSIEAVLLVIGLERSIAHDELFETFREKYSYITRTRLEYFIEKLLWCNFIEKYTNFSEGEVYYSLTSKAKEYLVKCKLV